MHSDVLKDFKKNILVIVIAGKCLNIIKTTSDYELYRASLDITENILKVGKSAYFIPYNLFNF